MGMKRKKMHFLYEVLFWLFATIAKNCIIIKLKQLEMSKMKWSEAEQSWVTWEFRRYAINFITTLKMKITNNKIYNKYKIYVFVSFKKSTYKTLNKRRIKKTYISISQIVIVTIVVAISWNIKFTEQEIFVEDNLWRLCSCRLFKKKIDRQLKWMVRQTDGRTDT